MSLPPYPRYRESGIEWLGEVPEHWKSIRLGALFRQTDDVGSEELPVLSVSIHNGVSDREFSEEEQDRRVTRSEDRTIYKRVQPGDLVYNMMRAWQGGFGSVTVPGMVSPAYVVARPLTHLRTEFIEQLLRTPQAIEELRRQSHGVTDFRLRLYWDEFRSIKIALPPTGEQIDILASLAPEIAKIDALVTEQQRLNKLLREKRQVVISQAVTKGLNRATPMKYSGSEWLGAVPKPWEVVRLGALLRETAEPGNEELPVLSVSIHNGVSDREFAEDEQDRKVARSDDRTKYKRVQPGDLVYNMMRAWQGGFGSVTVPGMVSPAYVVARPVAPIRTEFIEQLLRTPQAIEQLRRHSRGITDFRLRLYWDEFKSIKVAVPSFAEQSEILDRIGRETDKFDALIVQAEAGITLLQERRKALISAAVTGKIDVRHLSTTAREKDAAA